MSVAFNTGATYAEGKALLSPLIQEIVDQTIMQVGLDDELAKYGFVRETPLTPEGKITSMVGPEMLQQIDEDEEAPTITILEGFQKGYTLKTFAGQHKITKVFKKWIENGAQINGADSSVKAELMKLKDAVVRLTQGRILTMNALVAKTLANGFSVTTAYGPGSASPDGVALFSGSHVIKKTGGTYSNTMTAALAASSLQDAIDKHKLDLRSGNGYRIKTPDVFTLLVPRALETTARVILNSNGDQAGVYAGTANNANLLNVFSFQGNKVRLVVVDMIGQPDSDGSTIGGANADTMWFLLNAELAMQVKAFRLFTLWDNEVTMYENEATSSTFVKLDSHFMAEHFNPEVIVGSTGAA